MLFVVLSKGLNACTSVPTPIAIPKSPRDFACFGQLGVLNGEGQGKKTGGGVTNGSPQESFHNFEYCMSAPAIASKSLLSVDLQ